MTKTVGDIAINVTADVGPLTMAMKQGAASVSAMEKASKSAAARLNRFGDSAISIGKKMSIVSAGITAAATAAFALANNVATAGDKVAKTSRAIGVSSEYYQEMAYAIGQVSDLSGEELDKSLQRLTRTIGEGAEGTKTATEALGKLGFTQSQIASGTITTQQAFDAYISKMDGIKDPAIAAAVSTELLGRSGERLGAQLSGQSGAISDLKNRAQELGIVLSKDALNASEKFGDQTDDLKRSFEALKMKIGAELLPIFTEKLIPALQDHVIPALKRVAEGVADAVKWFTDLPAPVQEAAGAFALAFAVGGPILIGIGIVSKTLGALVAASGPVGLFIAAAGLAVTAWQLWGDDIKAAVGAAIEFVTSKFDALMTKIQFVIDKAVTLKTALTEALGFGERDINGGIGDMGAGQAGANIASGLVNGIGVGLEENNEQLRSYLNGVTNTAREEFGIQSPSRVFAEIGDYIGQGLAQGIASSQEMVRQATSVLGGQAVSGAQDTAQGVLSSMTTMFQGSKKIAAAMALTNSWLAFTEVLKDPSFIGRPWARIGAAFAALAPGLNAVKNIKSATIGGGVGGSAGGGGGGGQASAPPPPPPQQRSLTLIGDSFNKKMVMQVAEFLNDGTDNGLVLRGSR